MNKIGRRKYEYFNLYLGKENDRVRILAGKVIKEFGTKHLCESIRDFILFKFSNLPCIVETKLEMVEAQKKQAAIEFNEKMGNLRKVEDHLLKIKLDQLEKAREKQKEKV